MKTNKLLLVAMLAILTGCSSNVDNTASTTAEKANTTKMPLWPMIVLRTPKGWTGPKAVENSFKAHQIPLQIDEKNIQNIKELEKWMKSYKPEELFDENGKFLEEGRERNP